MLALLQSRINPSNTNFCTFCAKFLSEQSTESCFLPLTAQLLCYMKSVLVIHLRNYKLMETSTNLSVKQFCFCQYFLKDLSLIFI